MGWFTKDVRKIAERAADNVLADFLKNKLPAIARATLDEYATYTLIEEALPKNGTDVFILRKGRGTKKAKAHFDRWFCHPATGKEPKSTKDIWAWKYA